MAKKKIKKDLPKQQKLFARFRAEGLSIEKAALKAGYSESYAKARAYELLDNPRVSEEIKRIQKKIEEEFSYSIFKSYRKLEKIQEIILPEDASDDDKTKLKDNPQLIGQYLKAEDQISKMTGLYNDNHVHTGDIIINNMGTVEVGGQAFTLNIGEDPNAITSDETAENT